MELLKNILKILILCTNKYSFIIKILTSEIYSDIVLIYIYIYVHITIAYVVKSTQYNY